MNKNLLILLDTLLKDPEALEKCSDQNNIDELYKFCTSIVDGYSLEEFKEFLETLAKNNQEGQDSESKEKVPDSSLENVAGGLGSPAKMASALMSGLFVLGSTGISSQALSNNNNYSASNQNSISINQKVDNASEQRNNLKKIANIAQKFTNSDNSADEDEYENEDANEYYNENEEDNNKIFKEIKINGKDATVSFNKWNEAESGIGYDIHFDFKTGDNVNETDSQKIKSGVADIMKKMLDKIEIEKIQKDEDDCERALNNIRKNVEKAKPKDGKISFYMSVDMDLNTIEVGSERGIIGIIEVKDNLSKDAQRNVINTLVNYNFAKP